VGEALQPESEFKEYIHRLSMFSRNAKLYLLATVFQGLGSGIWVLFYLYLDLPGVGFDPGFISRMFAVGAIATGFIALPAGLLIERIGPKRAILIGLMANLVNIAQITVLQPIGLLTASISSGFIATVASVSVAPLLVESSNSEERAHLFSFQSVLSIIMSVVGSLIGGFLPDLFNHAMGYPTGSNGSPFGYRLALGISISFSLLAVLPVLLVKLANRNNSQKATGLLSFRFRNLKSFRTIVKFMIPTALTGFGAGFVIPLVNLFFKLRFGASPEEVGAISALGNVTLGLATLLTPILSRKMTRVRFIVICQYLSMPFIMLTSFSPNLIWGAGAYIVRTSLMNMAGPIGTTFQMESVNPDERATTSGLMTMSDQVPRALTNLVAGEMMSAGDFFTMFPIMTGTYFVSTSLYFFFFRTAERKKPVSST
jgi:MFS family permease